MNLLFVGTSLSYNVATPEQEPLGGSESSVCYLARALAARGHRVTLMARLPSGTPSLLMGVGHLQVELFNRQDLFDQANFDAIISQHAPKAGSHFRKISPQSLCVNWNQMMADQLETSDGLSDFDCSIYVSNNQRAGLPRDLPAQVIGNGIAPTFENMFTSAIALRDAKDNRGAYTSTPFRGLGALVAAMDGLKADTMLDIYGSMRLYQQSDNNFAGIYQAAQQNPRIRYCGAAAQPVLAQALRKTAFLFYPSGFPETYCNAAVEALAAGLQVVSTELGALPETTRGLATLMPMQSDPMEFVAAYRALMEKEIAAFKADKTAWAEKRFAQVQEINRTCTWAIRAKEWEDFLAPAISAKHA